MASFEYIARKKKFSDLKKIICNSNFITYFKILLLSSMLYEQDYLHQTVSNRANVELVVLVILTDRKNFHVLALVLGSRKCLKSSNRAFDANYAQVSG